MNTSDGFVPIVAMFFALFHPTEGTKVVHQVPSGSIVPDEDEDDSSALEKTLLDFDSIKNYVIPKPQLCNKLVTCKIGEYRVVGFPVNIYSSHYARNSFSFNFCFVFPYASDTTPYEGNIKRMGKMFRALEEQSQLLSKSEKGHEVFFKDASELNATSASGSSLAKKLQATLGPAKHISESQRYLKIVEDWDDAGNQMVVDDLGAPGRLISGGGTAKFSSLKSLIQQLFQDLNNYSECMIPIDAANSVDIKLFPIFPPPPEIDAFDVPIATVKLESMVDVLWDPTMLKIIPFVNGINSVQQISELAGADLELTRQCIQHLIHYKSVAILDVFQFSNCYAPTAQIGNFLRDPTMAAECQTYVLSPTGTFSDLPLRASRASGNSETMSMHSISRRGSSPSKATLRGGTLTMSVSKSPQQQHQQQQQQLQGRPPLTQQPSTKSSEPAGSLSRSSTMATIPKLTAHSNSQTVLTKKTIYTLPSKAVLFSLYRSLNQNTSVRQWYVENSKLLEHIDIRRLISFGLLKGIIYRVRSYPAVPRLANSIDFGVSYRNHAADDTQNYNVSALPVNVDKNAKSKGKNDADADDEDDDADADGNDVDMDDDDDDDDDVDSDADADDDEGDDGYGNGNESDDIVIVDTPANDSRDEVAVEEIPSNKAVEAIRREQRRRRKEEETLLALLKNTRDLDMICTTLKKSRRDVCDMMDSFGDWHMISS